MPTPIQVWSSMGLATMRHEDRWYHLLRDWEPVPPWGDQAWNHGVAEAVWSYYAEHGALPEGWTEQDVNNTFARAVACPSVLPHRYRYCDRCSVFEGYPCQTCGGCGNGHCDCVRCSCGTALGGRHGLDRLHRGYTNRECPSCGGCSHGCCRCRRCTHCQGVFARAVYCGDCAACDTHCSCNSLRSMREGSPWPDRSKRLCGVEWEFNRVKQGRPVRQWAKRWRGGIHRDGSCGWECVTPPIAGKHIEACLSDLGAAFVDAKAKADTSCGIHVHVDARDYSWPDMFRLLATYAHIEPLLFVIAGQQRILPTDSGRHYCQPVAEEYRYALSQWDRKGAVLALMWAPQRKRDGRRSMRQREVHKKAEGRYRSLNICPWLARHAESRERARDSTVEFRLHRNTLDEDRVTEWAKLCVAIVDYCAKATDREAEDLRKQSALRALCKIAPGSTRFILSRLREWRAATSVKSGMQRLVSYKPGKGWTCAA